jgi:hypothetical protein
MEDKTIVLKLELQIASAKANIKALESAIDSMDKRTLEAKKKMSQLAVEVDKVGNLKGKLSELKTEVGGLSKGMNTASAATGGATASVLEMGRVISDSNYGIRGVANNLSQLATNLVYTTRAAGGVAAGFKAIWSSLMGPLGILLAIQAVIAIIEKMSMAEDELKRNTKEATKEIDLQITALEKLGSLTGALFQNLGIIERFNAGTLSLADTISILSNRYSDFAKGYEKLSKEQQKDPEVLKRVINAYGDLLNTREKLDKKQKEAIVLQRQLNEEGEFLISNGLKTVNPVANTLASVNSEIIKLLKQENSLREFFTTIKEGKGKGKGKEDKPVFLGYLDEDFQKRLEEYKQRYLEYTEDRRAIEAEIEISQAELNANLILNENPRLQAEKEILDLKLQEDVARIDFMIEQRKREADSFADLEDEKLLILKQSQLDQQNLDQKVLDNKLVVLDYLTGAMNSFATLAGKNTGIGKALAVAAATIDTYAGATAALTDKTIPNTFARIAAVSTVIATGLANVKAILAVKVPNGGGGSAQNVPTGRTFDFNLVGSTGQNQLAQTIGGQVNQVIKAYVVSSEITNQQAFDNQIQGQATIGN